MRPPLVAELVRRHIGDEIDPVWIVLNSVEVLDEADTLGIGNRVGEGLRKRRIGRELKNARLAELIRREVFRVHVERRFHRRDHYAAGMRRLQTRGYIRHVS